MHYKARNQSREVRVDKLREPKKWKQDAVCSIYGQLRNLTSVLHYTDTTIIIYLDPPE